MSAMYAIYHGPEGLKNIALRVHKATLLLAKGTVSSIIYYHGIHVVHHVIRYY